MSPGTMNPKLSHAKWIGDFTIIGMDQSQPMGLGEYLDNLSNALKVAKCRVNSLFKQQFPNRAVPVG